MPRILSVSYDLALLSSRRLLLESLGYEVVCASDLDQALHHCKSSSRFDLFVLGHSIPCTEKDVLVAAFRAHCPAPVIALKKVGEEPTMAADFQIDPEPEQLLGIISQVISGNAASA